MLKYALLVGALFAGCLCAAKLGLVALGVLLFPLPVSTCIVRREGRQAVGLLTCAALAVWLGGGTAGDVVLYTMLAAVGVPLGVGILLRWTYGWTVTAVAALAYLALVGAFLLSWQEWLSESQGAWIMLQGELKNAPAEGNADSIAAMVEIAGWMKDHWSCIGVGLWLWPVIIAACMLVSFVSGRVKRSFGTEGFRGSFREMRTSEWLIWAAILAALLCFIDYRQPEWGLRIVAWNAAVALAAVYWLNGLAIFVFALDMLKAHFLLVMSIVFVFVWLMPHPFLCAVGMFDTWADFRRKLRRLAELRREREESDDAK